MPRVGSTAILSTEDYMELFSPQGELVVISDIPNVLKHSLEPRGWGKVLYAFSNSVLKKWGNWHTRVRLKRICYSWSKDLFKLKLGLKKLLIANTKHWNCKKLNTQDVADDIFHTIF